MFMYTLKAFYTLTPPKSSSNDSFCYSYLILLSLKFKSSEGGNFMNVDFIKSLNYFLFIDNYFAEGC